MARTNPFNKPNNISLHINKRSNHPPRIISNIHDCRRFRTIKNPSTKSSRKPSTTADRSTFSHFLHIFQFKLQTLGEKIGRETSFGTTPIGRTFLKLYLTRNSPRSMCDIRFLTETLSRSVTVACQTQQNIDGHNKSILHNNIVPPRSCNCRVKTEYPMVGNCRKESVVYQATVSTEDHNRAHTYVGLTKNSFKIRYSNHKFSFSNAMLFLFSHTFYCHAIHTHLSCACMWKDLQMRFRTGYRDRRYCRT